MTTRFASLFRRTGAPMLLHQFGEQITYYPRGAATGRTISAMVERGVSVPSETGDGVAMAIVVRVVDDSTEGISATEIDDGRDEVSIATITGGTAERRQITRVEADANGLVRFMVR